LNIRHFEMILVTTADKEAEKLISALKRWGEFKSQYAVAKLLGVDRERVSKWFSGKAVRL
jgi:hypothetical protein